MKQEKTISKIYNSKIFWIIVSLLCSFLLWSYVSGQDSKESTVTLSGIQVEFTGEDELAARSMSVYEVDTSSVTIRVRGNRSDLSRLKSSEIKAVIDVSKIQQPNDMSWTYDIRFPNYIDKSNIQVISRTPDTVNFTIVKNASKTVNVKGSFEGTISDACVAEELVFEPATITLEGPEQMLENVDYAWVKFGNSDLNIESTYSADVAFTLMDKDGKPCSASDIKSSVNFVTATQPILKTKELPLTVKLIPGGGITEADCTVTVEPSTIKIAADSRLIDDKNSIVLGNVELSSFNSSYTQTFTIPLEDGIQNLNGITEAKVTISVNGTHTKSFTTDNISCKNVTKGYVATIDTKEIEVTLRAKDAETLDKINASDISIVADLSDYGTTTGQVIVPATVSVSGHSDVGAVGDVKVTLTISKE